MIRQSGSLLGKNGVITLVNGPKYMGTLQGTNISHPKDDVPLGYVGSLEGNWGEMTPISGVIILLMIGRGPHCKDFFLAKGDTTRWGKNFTTEFRGVQWYVCCVFVVRGGLKACWRCGYVVTGVIQCHPYWRD